jgi:hypothetical protein
LRFSGARASSSCCCLHVYARDVQECKAPDAQAREASAPWRHAPGDGGVPPSLTPSFRRCTTAYPVLPSLHHRLPRPSVAAPPLTPSFRRCTTAQVRRECASAAAHGLLPHESRCMQTSVPSITCGCAVANKGSPGLFSESSTSSCVFLSVRLCRKLPRGRATRECRRAAWYQCQCACNTSPDVPPHVPCRLCALKHGQSAAEDRWSAARGPLHVISCT